MRAAMRAIDAGPVQGAAHDALHRYAAERDHWSDVVRNTRVRRYAWSGPLDVGDDGVANLLGQRQTLFAPRLAADGQQALIPVDLRRS